MMKCMYFLMPLNYIFANIAAHHLPKQTSTWERRRPACPVALGNTRYSEMQAGRLRSSVFISGALCAAFYRPPRGALFCQTVYRVAVLLPRSASYVSLHAAICASVLAARRRAHLR